MGDRTFHHKAEQCRRLAHSLATASDPAIAILLAMAEGFEAKATAGSQSAGADSPPAARPRDRQRPKTW